MQGQQCIFLETAMHRPVLRRTCCSRCGAPCRSPVCPFLSHFMPALTMPCVQGQQCIFLETAMNLRSARPQHAVLECIPVGQRELDKAPA